jgi:hypothetical protein
MATNKITLSELRNIVKQIIKEESASNRITFEPSDWNENLKIVYIDGKPLNGAFRGNTITIYFDANDQSSKENINNIIRNEFDVSSQTQGWSTKNQSWIEWKLS